EQSGEYELHAHAQSMTSAEIVECKGMLKGSVDAPRSGARSVARCGAQRATRLVHTIDESWPPRRGARKIRTLTRGIARSTPGYVPCTAPRCPYACQVSSCF